MYYIVEIWILSASIFLFIHGLITSQQVNKFSIFFEFIEYSIIILSFSFFILVDNAHSVDISIRTFWQLFILPFCVGIFYSIGFNIRSISECKFEYIILLLINIFLAIATFRITNLFSFFLIIEAQTLCALILIALQKKFIISIEASIKYMIFSGFGSTLYSYGSSILYGICGTLDLTDLNFYFINSEINVTITVFSSMLILIGLLVKLSLFPFHFWIADIYQASPNFVSSYMATISKSVFFITFVYISNIFYTILNFKFISLFAIYSIIIGSISAFYQTNFFRFIGYSSVSHIGFIVSIYCISTTIALATVMFYLLFYIMMIFGILLAFSTTKRNYRFDGIENFSGFNEYNFILSTSIAIIMFSFAGMPPLIGFFSKFLILYSAINSNYYIFILFSFITFLISSFYYIRIIKLLFFEKPQFKLVIYNNNFNNAFKTNIYFIIIVISFLSILFGFCSDSIFNFFIFIVKTSF